MKLFLLYPLLVILTQPWFLKPKQIPAVSFAPENNLLCSQWTPRAFKTKQCCGGCEVSGRNGQEIFISGTHRQWKSSDSKFGVCRFPITICPHRDFLWLLKNGSFQASQTSQQVRALAPKTDNPSSISIPLLWKKRVNSHKLSSCLHTCTTK